MAKDYQQSYQHYLKVMAAGMPKAKTLTYEEYVRIKKADDREFAKQPKYMNVKGIF